MFTTIAFFDSISVLGFSSAFIYSLRPKGEIKGAASSRVSLCLILGLLALAGGANALESSGLPVSFHRYQNFLELLSLSFLLIFMLSNEPCPGMEPGSKVKLAALGSEREYRLLIESQRDLIVKLDVEDRVLFVSPSCCEFFGKAEHELVDTLFNGKQFFSIFLAH